MNIEKYLVLNKYILSLFGADEFKVLQERLKDAREGFDAEGGAISLTLFARWKKLMKADSQRICSSSMTITFSSTEQQSIAGANQRSHLDTSNIYLSSWQTYSLITSRIERLSSCTS
jgi:hypothetical protein